MCTAPPSSPVAETSGGSGGGSAFEGGNFYMFKGKKMARFKGHDQPEHKRYIEGLHGKTGEKMYRYRHLFNPGDVQQVDFKDNATNTHIGYDYGNFRMFYATGPRFK